MKALFKVFTIWPGKKLFYSTRGPHGQTQIDRTLLCVQYTAMFINKRSLTMLISSVARFCDFHTLYKLSIAKAVEH